MNVTGTIFDIKRYAIHDGPGIRTTVFFKGCLLDCWWCQNPEGRKSEFEKITSRRGCGEEMVGQKVDVAQVIREVLKDTIFYDESGGGVTFSGGEPMMQPDFLLALLMACKEYDLHTALDTSGYAPFEDFAKIEPFVDLYLYDIKFINDDQHIKYTGVSNKLVLENLEKLATGNHDIIIRIPLVPGITDSDINLNEIIGFLGKMKNIQKVSLLPYNKLSEDKFERFNVENRVGRLKTHDRADITKIAGRFKAAALKVGIGG